MALTMEPGLKTAEAREKAVENVIHSGEMEGLRVGNAFREDTKEFIDGLLTTEQMIERVKLRYAI